MKAYFRLFPLPWVVFPGEKLNLHIFEERYRQLIHDCLEDQAHFGIPFYQDGSIRFGTLVALEALKKTYPDGRMDISARGLDVFEVLTFKEKTIGKLYPGGKIQTMPLDSVSDAFQEKALEAVLNHFFNLLGQRPEGDPSCLLSFRYSHKLGLSPEQELELLLLPSESARQEFLTLYLQALVPSLEKGEAAKNRIRQNGHFKTFDPLEF